MDTVTLEIPDFNSDETFDADWAAFCAAVDATETDRAEDRFHLSDGDFNGEVE